MIENEIGDLGAAVERFIATSDSGNMAEIERIYAKDFLCLRAPDTGQAMRLPRDTMLSILASGTNPQRWSGTTSIDSVEIIDGLGVVVLRREKDVGHGPEVMFYCLIWRLDAAGWQFVREYVHQHALPGAVVRQDEGTTT
ncbi:MAG TPA: hypothetical protein VGV07_12680 [Devosia sp.]|jgi:hypothetical protein|uniref:hypothetical protein n=1 Tax=Devosia sp. TaxID=1871048 RepID=UPI002DDD52AE|nr:hypothetical protein [Devosia sp.]HEV2516100.1 hypothetical protein [Devosia sp.]